MRHYRIVLMGSGGVGKTSLIEQFVREVFESRYEPTIEDVHHKTIEVDGEMCSLEVLDTAGVEQFAQMRNIHITEGQGFILIYSAVNRDSFKDVQMMHEEIIKIKSTPVPLLLVGNKRDLAHLREVDTKEGEDLALRWPHCRFMETSAKSSQDAANIFATAARQAIKYEESSKYDRPQIKKTRRCVVM